VLILGETGAGKGVLARWLHNAGPRAREPFVDLNCAGLAKDLLESELFGHEKGAFTGAAGRKTGLLEAADRGTTFLDEIGDMDLSVQPKLLKVIEEQRFRRLGEVRERTVDVRFIAATHQDLQQLADARAFRHDLLYRINVVTLRVPPLRDRRDDIPLLAADILRGLRDAPAEVRLTPEGEQALMDYHWPGNVRELRNVLERALLLADGTGIGPDALDLPLRRVADAPAFETSEASLQALQLQQIARVLREEGGHVERAAHRLGIPRSTLYQKIRKYGLTAAGGGADS
jgi:DNA-binding NtrC family response regulator